MIAFVTRPLTVEEQGFLDNAGLMYRCSTTPQDKREALELLYRLGHQQGQIDALSKRLKEAA